MASRSVAGGGTTGFDHRQSAVLHRNHLQVAGAVSTRWSRRKTTALKPTYGDPQGQGHQRDCSRDQKLAKALWAGSGGGCNSP